MAIASCGMGEQVEELKSGTVSRGEREERSARRTSSGLQLGVGLGVVLEGLALARQLLRRAQGPTSAPCRPDRNSFGRVGAKASRPSAPAQSNHIIIRSFHPFV